jgi:hypothetical protein
MTSEPFGGVIGRYHDESTAWWLPPRRALAGAPNVLLIILDDVGFAQLGCFGSDIDTPVLERIDSLSVTPPKIWGGWRGRDGGGRIMSGLGVRAPFKQLRSRV